MKTDLGKPRRPGICHRLSGLAIVAGLLPPPVARTTEAITAEHGKLIHAGATVNAQDWKGVRQQTQAVVPTFIAARTETKLKVFHGDTALELARQPGCADIQRLLVGATRTLRGT